MNFILAFLLHLGISDHEQDQPPQGSASSLRTRHVEIVDQAKHVLH